MTSQTPDLERLMSDLLGAVRTAFEVELAKGGDAAPALERILASLGDLSVDPSRPAPAGRPVCRHLPRALELGEAGPAGPVARVFRDLEPSLTWIQNPRHTVETRGARFMENYAYTNLGLTGSDVLSLGFLLLGPGVTYPLTSYPEEGVFYVVGGAPEWQLGDGPWRPAPAGSIIYRPPGGSEGKRPGDEPLLALYAWLST